MSSCQRLRGRETAQWPINYGLTGNMYVLCGACRVRAPRRQHERSTAELGTYNTVATQVTTERKYRITRQASSDVQYDHGPTLGRLLFSFLSCGLEPARPACCGHFALALGLACGWQYCTLLPASTLVFGLFSVVLGPSQFACRLSGLALACGFIACGKKGRFGFRACPSLGA